MPQTLESLERDLERGEMRPLYLISGDETLLVGEAVEAIVTRARSLGFAEREIVYSDASNRFRFSSLRERAGAASLFESRRVLDLRIPREQMDKSAGDALVSYAQRPAADVCLVIGTGQFEARQRNTVWFKKLAEAAYTVLVWPLKERELIPWLSRRAEKAGFRLAYDAVRFLAMQVEGNLLAASQEIEKLAIMASQAQGEELSLEQVRSEVANSTHFNSFQLMDAAFEGSGRRVARLLRSLRLEGEEVMRLLGLVVSQLRMLKGGNPMRVPAMKRRAMERTMERLGTRGVEELLGLAEQIDRQVKGVEPGDPWRTLERLLLGLAGYQVIANSVN